MAVTLDKFADIFKHEPKTLSAVFGYYDETNVCEKLKCYLIKHPDESEDAANAIIKEPDFSTNRVRNFNPALHYILQQVRPEFITDLIKTTRSVPGSSLRYQRALMFRYGEYTPDLRTDLETLIQYCKEHGDPQSLKELDKASTKDGKSLLVFTESRDTLGLDDGHVIVNVNAPFQDHKSASKTYKTYLHFVATHLYYTPGLYDFVGVADLFLRKGASTSIADEFGSTVLHTAVQVADANGLRDLISVMRSYGRSLEEKDSDGRTPMELAKYCGKHEFKKLLHDAGATR